MIPGINKGVLLLVEDDENDVFFFQRAFRKTAFANQVQVARDGFEAIQYLGGEGEFANRTRFPVPILMVLDLNLPRRHGIDVLRWVRSRPELRSMVVVVLTSSSSDIDLSATYELGVNSYLLKPAEPDRLLEMVQAMAAYWLTMNRAPSLTAGLPPRVHGSVLPVPG